MKPADNIKKFFKNAAIDTNPKVDEIVLDEILNAHDKAINTQSATDKLNTLSIIMKSNMTKLAAAAVIIIAVLIGVKMISGSDKETGQTIVRKQDITQKEIAVESPKDIKPGLKKKFEAKLAAEKLEAELKDVEQMFAAGDVAGLVDMLDKGQWETKVAAANYLAKIGDLSAVGALEKLNKEWASGSEKSPFAAAIEEIRNRMAGGTKAENITDNIVVGFVTDTNTSQPNDIYIVTKVTWSNGQLKEYKDWLKDEVMLRQEHPDKIIIDNGISRLVLDKEKKTAQLMDSHAPFENYIEDGRFEIVSAFMGYDTTVFKISELPAESNSIGPVYKVAYRDFWEAKAWVDAQSNLPIRLFTDDIEGDSEPRAVALEMVFNYDPIALEKFKITVPPDFDELPRLKPRIISGWVVDENGKPVVGANVYTSEEEIWAKTNEKGEFVIELHPGGLLGELPMFIRAFKSNNPHHAAWTLLRNPRHELRPLYIPDDGKTKYESGGNVDIKLVDTNELTELLPSEPGDIIFRKETDRYPCTITNVVLEMIPASVITGRVTNNAGGPIANATVWIDNMQVPLGKNEIDIRSLGCPDKDKDMTFSPNLHGKTFTVTDANGYYEFGNLPNEWSEVRLEAKATGYTTEGKRIYHEQYCDFALTEANMIIRGTVIDNWGEPLVGRKVEIDIEDEDDEHDYDRDFDIEEAVIDANGRFELVNIPAVPGLELEIRADEEPYDWGENEQTQGREFVYYLMIEEPVYFEPGKKEYWVEIVPHKPDITIEVEIKNSNGDLLENIPIGICSPGFSERMWYLTKLIGKTNEYGLCIITEAPRINPLNLWICQPKGNIGVIEGDLSQEYATAIAESQEYYSPMKVPIELKQNKKEYRVSVTLLTIEEYKKK